MFPTFEDRLQATGRRPAGFDYLRICLATSVIFFHSFDLTHGYAVAVRDAGGLFRPFYVAILPMFFALSGFLIAGSLARSRTLISFLGLRVIRLAPALLVETVFSAIVIGLIFTVFPYKHYFLAPTFRSYFLNIVGDIHYNLPGVFLHLPFANIVNLQLWTIPWELRCYLTISAIALVGIARRKYAFLVCSVALNIVLFVHHAFMGVHQNDHTVGAAQFEGPLLVVAFLYGIAFFMLREKLPWNRGVFVGALVLALIVTSKKFGLWGDYASPLIFAYMTIFLGLAEPKRLKIVSSGDYSYGMYLYGFPIQQAAISVLGPIGLHWYVNSASPPPWRRCWPIAPGIWWKSTLSCYRKV